MSDLKKEDYLGQLCNTIKKELPATSKIQTPDLTPELEKILRAEIDKEAEKAIAEAHAEGPLMTTRTINIWVDIGYIVSGLATRGVFRTIFVKTVI